MNFGHRRGARPLKTSSWMRAPLPVLTLAAFDALLGACNIDSGSAASNGTFYEGCIVTGYPLDATEDAVQANVVAAKYGE
jgi:hypothetical protein